MKIAILATTHCIRWCEYSCGWNNRTFISRYWNLSPLVSLYEVRWISQLGIPNSYLYCSESNTIYKNSMSKLFDCHVVIHPPSKNPQYLILLVWRAIFGLSSTVILHFFITNFSWISSYLIKQSISRHLIVGKLIKIISSTTNL